MDIRIRDIPGIILNTLVNSIRIPIAVENKAAYKHLLKNFGFLKSSDKEKDTNRTKNEYPNKKYFITFIPVILKCLLTSAFMSGCVIQSDY